MSKAVAVLILSILLLGCATDQEIEQQIADSPVVLEVTAIQLQADYEANDVAADLKYKDKVIAVTGIVTSIVSKDSGGASVGLRTGNFVEGVRCHFTEQHINDVAGLREGDWVKLRGQGEGKGLTDIFDVSVRACSLLEHQPGGTIAAQPTSSGPVVPSATQVPTTATPAATPTPTATRAATSASPATIIAPTVTPTQIARPTTVAPSVATPSPTAIPTPTLTPAPMPTPTLTLTPTPIPPGMTLDNPVAAGEVLQGADGTEIVVTAILEDATGLVLETNQFNDPPEPGNRFYMVTVAVSYMSGTDSLNVAEADYSLIGDNRIVYAPFDNSCGVIPDELSAELFPGGRTEGNICFQIESDDSNFVLIHEPFYSFEGERRFLSLDPTTVGSTENFTAAVFPTPNPANLVLPAGMTLDNPIAQGEVLQGTDGTEIVVFDILQDATSMVLETNQFNDPPEPGNRFYMVAVAVSYISGSDSLNVAEADYSLVGGNRIVYTPFENSCGVIPDGLSAELFPGGRAEGNVCFQIESDDSNFVLIHEPFYSFEGERRFLSLE